MKTNQHILNVLVYLCIVIMFVIMVIGIVISYRRDRHINDITNKSNTKNIKYNSCSINERNFDIENGKHKMYYQMEFIQK